MNRTRWISVFSLIFVFSTACLTLFPQSPEPPTKKWNELGPLKFEPSELPNAKVGVPYEAQIKVTQNVTPVGDFLVEPETLPPGLELISEKDGADTATITGIPEQAGTYTFRIDAWCYGTSVNGQMSSKVYTIVIE